MIKQWLSWINIGIGSLTVALLLLALIITFLRPSEIAVADTAPPKRPLPNGAFTLTKQAYDAIGKTGCNLKFTPMTLQIPDLRNQLIYYGRNGRPDAQADHQVLHFSFANNVTPFSITVGERIYLSYERKPGGGQYCCSPWNLESPMWLEVTSSGNTANIHIFMRDEDGHMITEPEAHAQFSLQEKEAARANARAWDMGKYRVDGSLLARQKAKWMGQDLFLARHGGDEFSDWQNKHRLDFIDDEDNAYSVYAGLNDPIIWKDNRWHEVKAGTDSVAYPLMIVKKVDERIMTFDLWDVGGRSKVPLTLIKTSESWSPQQVQDKFTFLGARTRSQYIFEIDGQRMLISPKDWLLQTEEGWIKLSTPQLVDDYVERKLVGVLFVVDGLTRKEGKQVLLGMIFNPARTETQEIEIPVQQQAGRIVALNNPNEDDDDDEDEDDEDDDEDSDE